MEGQLWISWYGFLSNKDMLLNMMSCQTQTFFFPIQKSFPAASEVPSLCTVEVLWTNLSIRSHCIHPRRKILNFKINEDHLLSWCIVLTKSDVREAPESQSGNFVGQDATISLGCCCVVWQLLLLIWLSGPAGVSVFTQLASKDLHLSSHDLYSTDCFFFFFPFYWTLRIRQNKKDWPYFHVGSRFIKFSCISSPS